MASWMYLWTKYAETQEASVLFDIILDSFDKLVQYAFTIKESDV